jgi:hypothetical protein
MKNRKVAIRTIILRLLAGGTEVFRSSHQYLVALRSLIRHLREVSIVLMNRKVAIRITRILTRADGDATERTHGVLGTKIAGDVDGDLVPLVGGIDEGVGRMVHTGDVRASEVGVRSRLRHVSKVGGRWNGCAGMVARIVR